MHWNSNSIKNKYIEFISFLETQRPSIISLNETKLTDKDALDPPNYNVIRSDRNSRGGGVAILISNKIDFEQVGIFNKFNLEIVCIKIRYNSRILHFISWYLPPNAEFPEKSFFNKLSKLKYFILTGDLNCKSKAWYARVENQNGKKLNEIISESQITILKNKKPTHFSASYNSFDITDLILTSPDLNKKIKNLLTH